MSIRLMFVAICAATASFIILAATTAPANQAPGSPAPEKAGEITSKLDVGHWAIVPFIVGTGRSLPMFLLDVSGSEAAGFTAKVIDNATGRSGWVVKSIDSSKGLLRIEIEADNQLFSFVGSQQGAFARGELVMPSGAAAPTRIWPTNATTLQKYAPPEEEFHTERAAASRADEAGQIAALQSFAEQHPQSPLALDACHEILRIAKRGKVETAAVEKAIEKYVELAATWGQRLAKRTRIAVAELLFDEPPLHGLAVKSIVAAENSPTADEPLVWKDLLDVIKGFVLIRSADAAQSQQGAEIVRKQHQQNIFDTRISAELLKYEESRGNLDAAIELAAEFAAFPPTQEITEQWIAAKRGGMDPRAKFNEQVTALWVKKHGSTDGLDKRLDETYLKALNAFDLAKDSEAATAQGNRVVLVELFTGAGCPPCLAADMALANLAQAWPSSDVAILRYQRNVPDPDPMANLPGEMRARYYDAKTTPTAYVDGVKVESVDGFRDRVPQVARTLRGAVGFASEVPSELQLKITADNQGGMLFFTAEVEGLRDLAYRRRFARFGIAVVATSVITSLLAVALLLLGPRSGRYLTARLDAPWLHALLMKRVRIVLAAVLLVVAGLTLYQLVPNDTDVADLRLRMAVTEDQISYAASNGVRIHDSVVRAMPASERGVGIAGGRISFSGKIDVAKFRQQLVMQIATIETNFGVKFQAKPLELRQLNFVAFVQSDANQEILQAASAPFKESGSGTPASTQSAEVPPNLEQAVGTSPAADVTAGSDPKQNASADSK